MKLYYSPGACSLSPHIALHEAGLPHELVKVDLKAKKTENGDDFTSINPKGQVPALQLDNGELLTEGPVIVQAIADQAAGKNFSPLFQPAIPDEVKSFFKDRIKGKFKYADSKLAGQDYLMGKQFTVADGYLFVMLKWAERTGMDLSRFKNLMTFKDRVAARPNVQAALKMEGLLKAA